MLYRDIFCFIPACNETEEEVTRSLSTFRRECISDEALRNRLRLFIILDRQRDNAPDTHTFVALKKLLGIQLRSQVFIKKHGCRVFSGEIDSIPYSLYIKGDNLIAGKRYSILLFADILQKYESKSHKDPRYLLFLDSDTETNGKDINYLVDIMERDPNCGGVTGWLKVANSDLKNPVVSMQDFMIYFWGHVIEKAANSIFKKCTVLPGAFSLIKYSCFKECLKEFSRVPHEGEISAINLLELGEDRYLTTLLLSKGYNTHYAQGAISHTVIPDTLYSFLTQQRRWTQSTLSNNVFLLFNKKIPLLRSSQWGVVQWLILCSKFFSTLLITGTTAVIIAQGSFGDFESYWVALATWGYLTIFSLTIMNTSVAKRGRWIVVNIFLLAVLCNNGVFCGFSNAVQAPKYPTIALLFLRPILSFYAIFKFSKPRDWIKFVFGFILTQFSFIHTTITLYSIANLDNRSWGTRGIVHEEPFIELRKYITCAFLSKNWFYLKDNTKWKAVRRSGKISGFWKKVGLLVLFSLINLFYILLTSSLVKFQNDFIFFLSLFIFYIACIPEPIMSTFYHYCMSSLQNKKN